MQQTVPAGSTTLPQSPVETEHKNDEADGRGHIYADTTKRPGDGRLLWDQCIVDVVSRRCNAVVLPSDTLAQ